MNINVGSRLLGTFGINFSMLLLIIQLLLLQSMFMFMRLMCYCCVINLFSSSLHGVTVFECFHICLCDNSESYRWIFVKLWKSVNYGQEESCLNFASDRKHILDILSYL